MSDWDRVASSGQPISAARDEEELSAPLLAAEHEPAIVKPEAPLAELNVRMQNEVLKFRQNIEQINRMAGQLGTREDSRALRKHITEIISRTEALSSSINTQFRESNLARKDAARNVSLARSKLQRDFQREVAAFQEVVRKVMDAQQRNRLRSSISESGAIEPSSSVTSDSRFQVQVHEDFDEMLAQERDAEIATIQHTMNTVNAIYKDLAVIMEEQKSDLDLVESQVDTAHNRAAQGRKEIDKASSDQKKTGKAVIWVLSVLIVVGIIVIVIMVGDVTKK